MMNCSASIWKRGVSSACPLHFIPRSLLRATMEAIAGLESITIFHEPDNVRADNVARISRRRQWLWAFRCEPRYLPRANIGGIMPWRRCIQFLNWPKNLESRNGCISGRTNRSAINRWPVGCRIRRIDLIWQGEEVAQYDKLKSDAAKSGFEIPQFVKVVLAKVLKQ